MAQGLEPITRDASPDPLGSPGDEVQVSYGFPFRGFNDALPRDQINRHQVAADSLQFVLEPHEGAFQRRRGMVLQADAIMESGITSPTYSFRGVKVGEFRSPTLSPNFPVGWMALMADEDATNSPAVLHYGDDNFIYGGGGSELVGYNANWASGTPNGNNSLVWPWLGGNRMRAATDRIRHASGSRGYIDVAGWVYFPNFGDVTQAYDGVPQRWNKRHNSGVAGQRIERLQPTGLAPPMWMPRIAVPASVGADATGTPWRGRDLFFVSVLFIYEDGSWGPFIPVRAPNPDLQSGVTGWLNDYSPVDVGGYGLIRLSSTATASFRSVTWSGIPIGPEGVIARVLLRSLKVDGTAGATIAFPDPKSLAVVDILWNNTQTSYEDSKGLDAELVTDLKIRVDHIWPLRARHIGHFDQRVAVAFVRENSYGLLVQCRGVGATDDRFNTTDDAVATTREAYLDISGTTLSLYIKDGGTDLTHRRQYALSGITLQTLVDRINSQGGYSADSNASGTRYRWHAQLVPGADGTTLATRLDATGTTSFGDRSWTTAAANILDGDTSIAGGTALNPVRCLASSWPGALRYDTTNRRTYKDLLYFTRGGPGEAANAAMAFALGNHRFAPPDSGDIMGILSLLDGALVPCSKKICILRNVHEGKTGLDEDYRLEVADSQRGCISPSMAEGPGFVVILTTQGLYAYDYFGPQGGVRALLLSETLYLPGPGTGQLASEIAQSLKATDQDNNDSYFNVSIGNNQIWISYRSSTTPTRPNRQLVMDFSPGKDQRGIEALIDPDTGHPWGWSTPLEPISTITGDTAQKIAPSAMAYIELDPGSGIAPFWIGTRDRHISATVEGRIERFDTGTDDNGTAISNGALYCRTDMIGGLEWKHMALSALIQYSKNGTGLTLAHARSRDAHANPSYFRTKALASSASLIYERLWWQIPLAGRGPTDASEVRVTDDGTTTSRPKAWGAKLKARIVDVGT